MTSLFGAAGRGYDVAAAKRGVTSLLGAAGRGNILHNLETWLIRGSILAVPRVTLLLGGGGFALNNFEAPFIILL